MGQKHSGWSRTYSGQRASSTSRSSGSSGGSRAKKPEIVDLSIMQLREAIAASDRGPAAFDNYVDSLPPREDSY